MVRSAFNPLAGVPRMVVAALVQVVPEDVKRPELEVVLAPLVS